MIKPDLTFVVTICPVFDVHGCAEKQAQESRGMFGFHSFTTCPQCRVIARGYQYWGENGHCQGSAANQEGMKYWVARKAREQWRTRDGKLMGYRFRVGQPLYYRASEVAA